jgi:hypothetical protein
MPSSSKLARRAALPRGASILKGVAALAAGGLVVLCGSEARAQAWLKDRNVAQGAGFKVGDWELHPGLGIEVGADSNWYMRTDRNVGAVNGPPAVSVDPAPVMKVTPSFFVNTGESAARQQGESGPPRAPDHRFTAGGSLTYIEFFGVLKPEQRNGSANVSARGDFFNNSPVGFGVGAFYTRTVAPNTSGNPDASFNRNTIGGEADVTIRPGVGTLDWLFGYRVRGNVYDKSQGVPFNGLNHQILTRGRWKFRPRTAVLYEGGVGFDTYLQKEQTYNALYNSIPIRSKLGISGLVTPRISTLLMAGWVSSFFDTGPTTPVPQLNTLTAQAEGTFYLSSPPEGELQTAQVSLSTLSIGFVRDGAQSLVSNYTVQNRGYLRLQWFIAQRAVVSLEGGASAVEYPRVLVNTGDPLAPGVASESFYTARADATLFGEYRFTQSLGLNLTGRFTGEFSDKLLPTSGGNFAVDYKRFEAYLGFRWFM